MSEDQFDREGPAGSSSQDSASGDKPRRRRRRRRGGGGGGAGGGGEGGAEGGRGDGPRGEGGGSGGGGGKKRRRRKRGGSAGKGATGGFERQRSTEHDDSPVEFDPDISNLGDAFDLETTFPSLGLRNSVLHGLKDAGFRRPTKIQSQLIRPLLEGRDMFGQAKTGTGKTAAFALPILNTLEAGTPFQALILVPTRELAIQVATDFNTLGKHTPLRALPVYGGQRIEVQAKLLDEGPEVLVATPGRVMDMVERRYMHYDNLRWAVLDEVDRMLDIGFRDDIRRILSACPKERQTVFVSATLSDEIERLAKRYCKDNVEKIVTTSGALTVELVRQRHLTVERWDKKRLLVHLLTHEEPALTIVFCRMKRTVDDLTSALNRAGIHAHAIHGDLPQSKRTRIIEQLKGGDLSVLIASDLASRGLDVEGITHVINYDLPEDPDLYVHRIGRTARAGREGVAWSLVTPQEGPLLTEIEKLINAEIPLLEYPDFQPSEPPADELHRRQRDAERLAQLESENRFKSTAAPPPVEQADEKKFPGGLVPTKLPPKRFGGKVRTRR